MISSIDLETSLHGYRDGTVGTEVVAACHNWNVSNTARHFRDNIKIMFDGVILDRLVT